MVWPTINKESVEMQLIKHICRRSFVQDRSLDLATQWQRLNWPKFLQSAQRNEVASLVYSQLGKLSLDKKMPSDIRDNLKNAYYSNIKHNILFCNEYLRVHDALQKEQIEHVPIKGLGLLYTVYQDISLRPMCDIDLMVKRKDFSALKKVMFARGYQLAPADNLMNKKMLFSGRGILVEVHDDLYSSYAESIHFPQSWGRLREQKIDGEVMLLLSIEDLFLSSALHHHFFYDSLKSSVDIMLILNSKTDEMDWDYIAHSARRVGVLSMLWYKLMAAFNAFNLPLKDEIFNKLKGRGYSYKKAIFARVIERKRNFSENQTFSHQEVAGAWFAFLLFDSWWQWVEHFLNKCIRYLTVERFARFCSLKYPSSFTRLCYSRRFFFIPLRLLFLFIKTNLTHASDAVGKRQIQNERLSMVRAWGGSMYPNIRDGDTVILKEKRPSRGDVICFKDDSEKDVIHRVVRVDKGCLFTKGDNSFNLDKPIKNDAYIRVGVATKRGDKLIPIKGKWLYGKFCFLGGLIIVGRRLLKNTILWVQDLGIYPKMAKHFLKIKGVDITETVETDDFYFVRVKINGTEAGSVKIDKKTYSILHLYVKVPYRKLGIEQRLAEKCRELKR